MFSADLGGYTAPLPAATDPPLQKVALLLHGDGTNGAQNNTFLDSSTNNFTITRTGNVAQGTFSPFSVAEGQWSNYFDGTGDYLQFPTLSSSTFDFPAGTDFTMEAWIYPVSGRTMIISTCGNNGYSGGISFVTTATTFHLRAFSFVNNTVIVDGTTAVPFNQWSHVAVTREGTTVRLFLNGVLDGTGTNNQSFDPVDGNGGIGGYSVNQSLFSNGYVSNARIVKGTAVYTSNFNPSTTPLTAISGTSLLTCQSNRFKDNSSNNFTITPAGDTKVTAFSPFAPSAAYSASTNGGSGYFDGSGDYLYDATSRSIYCFDTDYTVEAFIYVSSLAAQRTIICLRNQSISILNNVLLVQTNGTIGWSDGSAYSNTSNTINIGSWNHVALVKNGTGTGNIKVYINGVLGMTYSGAYNPSSSNRKCYIGAFDDGGDPFFGYISNIRLIRGTALYTANFTPPTSPLTAVTNTQLLLNCTNAGIFDNAGKNDIETVGDAQISTSVVKYGTGSMAFDGTGDYLTFQNKQIGDFGTGDFTAELWVYAPSTATANLVDFRGSGGGGTSLRIAISDNKIWAGWTSDNQLTSLNNISTNTWFHIAVTRSGSTARLFINGVLNRTITNSTSIVDNGLVVGSYMYGAAAQFNGYIDDLRITKGQALYTSNFTPPTQAFPNV